MAESEGGDLEMKRMTPLLLLLMLVLGACAAGPNGQEGVATQDGDVAGFWLGLWHGIITPVTFVISLFKDSVSFYEIHNNGNWYNFGYVLGAGMLFGGGAAGSATDRKRDR